MSEKHPKILVVEDIKIAQKLAGMILHQLNCEVDTADNGVQAIECYNKQTYDLIFMDLGLPDMDGLTVTETIRKLESKPQHTPIVALTAHDDADVKKACLEHGMDDFLAKPLTPQAASSILQRFVEE